MPVLEIALSTIKAVAGARRFRDAMRLVRVSAADADKALARLETGMSRLNVIGDRTLRTITGLSGALLAMKVARDAGRVASDFSKSLATLAGVTRASDEELKALEKTARRFGATTIFTAAESAQALVTLSRAGLESGESIATLGPVLDLAAAANIGLADSADIVVQSMKQFSIPASEAARIVDILVNTANSAKTTIPEMSQALEFAGASAASTGLQLEEVAAALGLLADRGIEASIAGTNVRGIIAQLAGATNKQKRAIDELGLSMKDVTPVGQKLSTVFENLGVAGLDVESSVALFQRRNFQAGLILADNVDILRELTQANKDMTGTARISADFINQSLFGAFRRLKSVAQEVVLSTGDSGLLGSLKGLVNFTADVLRVIFDMNLGMKQASVTARILADVIKFLTIRFIALKATKFLVFLFFELGAAALTAARGIIFLTAAMARNPIGLIAIGVATLITLMGTLRRETRGAAESFDDLDLSAQKMKELTESINRIRSRGARAAEIGDTQGQINQLKFLINRLEEIRIDVNEGIGDLFRDGDIVKITGLSELMSSEEAEMAVKDALDKIKAEILSQSKVLPQRNRLFESFLPGDPRRAGGNSPSLAGIAGAITGMDKPDAIKIIDAELKSVNQTIADLQKQLADAAAAEELKKATDRLGELIEKVKEERELIGLSDNAQEILIARRQAMKKAIKDEINLTEEFLGKLEEEIQENQRLQAAEDDKNDAADEASKIAEDTRRQRKQAIEQLDDLVRRTDDQTRLLRVEGNERELLAIRIQAENIARGQNIDNVEELIVRLQKLTDEQIALRKATSDREAAERDADRLAKQGERDSDRRVKDINTLKDGIKGLGNALDFERSILGDTADERNRAREGQQLSIKLTRLNRLEIEEFGKALTDSEGELEKYKEKLLELEEAQRIRDMFDDMARSVGDAFESMIFDAGSFEDAMEKTIKNIARLVFQQLVTQQIVNVLGGGAFKNFGGLFGAASGAAISGGRVVPFASGGVVDRPSFFPLRGGKTGVRGEAGEEGIFPLTRTPGGDLAIKSMGGGGVNIQMTIITKDENSFRQAESQITRRLTHAIRRSAEGPA